MHRSEKSVPLPSSDNANNAAAAVCLSTSAFFLILARESLSYLSISLACFLFKGVNKVLKYRRHEVLRQRTIALFARNEMLTTYPWILIRSPLLAIYSRNPSRVPSWVIRKTIKMNGFTFGETVHTANSATTLSHINATWNATHVGRQWIAMWCVTSPE